VIRTTVFRRRASEPCHTRRSTPARRNELSKKIAASLSVPVNDLYGLVIAGREKLQGFGNLHFTPAGSQLMGQACRRADPGIPQPIPVS